MRTFCKAYTVKFLDEYIIPFAGLNPGIHSYRLQIDRAFFDYFNQGEIKDGQLDVQLELEKEERMMIFRFRISGEVTLPCDRCNEPVVLPVQGDEQLIVKFGKEYAEQSDEVLVIPETESQFNTAPSCMNPSTCFCPCAGCIPMMIQAKAPATLKSWINWKSSQRTTNRIPGGTN